MKEISSELSKRDVAICMKCGAIFEGKVFTDSACLECEGRYTLRWVTLEHSWIHFARDYGKDKEEIKVTEQKTLEHAITELYFDYACRALLGGGKGMYVMVQLYEHSPEVYRVMLEAANAHLAKAHDVSLEQLDERYRQLQVIVGDLDKERSN